MDDFHKELQDAVVSGSSKDDLSKLKIKLSKKYGLSAVPSDTDVLLKGVKLLSKPSRTVSGVAPLALMTAPFACPHGKCLYCPGGPGSAFGDVPQSYTGHEPSTMRAIRNAFDPYLISFNRLEQFVVNGHVPEKIEVIVQGGTFPAMPKAYQEEFITFAFKGMNDFGDLFYSDSGVDLAKIRNFFELPGKVSDSVRVKNVLEKVRALRGSSSLLVEQARNESARIRCVALCIETKPDWCFEEHIDGMLRFGTTRVELGVQGLSDEVMKRTNRGHSLADVWKASKLLKDSLLKVGYHMMPGLPGSSFVQDIGDWKELFSNPHYMPDAVKIYPTLVMKGTGLWGLWKAGKYTPRTSEEMADIIVQAKRFIPKWCRVMRIQRDIPSTVIEAGPNMTNMRQLVEQKLKENGIVCKCIRCREPRGRVISWADVKLLREDYVSSGGKEIFLSFEDVKNDLLLGFCRLRIISESHRPEVVNNSAGIRELHVYGQAVPLGGEVDVNDVQHRGLGKRLMAEAERIALEEFGCKKLVVISGVGVREYYRNLGFVNDGPYMSKLLD